MHLCVHWRCETYRCPRSEAANDSISEDYDVPGSEVEQGSPSSVVEPSKNDFELVSNDSIDESYDVPDSAFDGA